jgi:hypothetical protein
MLVAIIGAGTALAYDDGEEAPFVIGTEISSAFGLGGVVLANINSKSYVWDEATNRCWAYQTRPIKDVGYTSTMIIPIENLTGTCDRYKPKAASPPAPITTCERTQITMGYTYRMPVIETGGYAYGAVPSTSTAVCTTVPASSGATQ